MDMQTVSCRCLSCPAPSAPAAASVATPRILGGVLSGPLAPGPRRRDAIRKSWMQYPGVGTQLTVCFALGSRALTKRKRKSLDAPDVMWLDVDEPKILTMSKVFAWWHAASKSMHWFTHAVKIDDDSYVHVPNLLADVTAAAARAPHLCYAPIAHAGYNPSIFRMCGWSWQRSMTAWRSRGCEARGMSPPFAFPLGAFQLLSSSLVRMLGASEEVAAFARAANASDAFRGGRESNEDVALGYWLWKLRRRHDLNVSYVAINSRATNLGCFRNGGLYQQPKADAIVIHRIKGASGMHYVWRRLERNMSHDAISCARDAEIELPKGAFIFDKSMERKVRSGEAVVEFNQKTSTISMRFVNMRLPKALRDAPELFFGAKAKGRGGSNLQNLSKDGKGL